MGHEVEMREGWAIVGSPESYMKTDVVWNRNTLRGPHFSRPNVHQAKGRFRGILTSNGKEFNVNIGSQGIWQTSNPNRAYN